MDALTELSVQKGIILEQLKREKHRQHKLFLKENKVIMRCLDILVAVIVLMNFGAVAITNMLVTKKDIAEGDIPEFVEVNPVHAAMGDYEVHPNYQAIMMAVAMQAMIWFCMIGLYVWRRMTIYRRKQLIMLVVILAYYTLIMGLDFFNDVGLFAGVTG